VEAAALIAWFETAYGHLTMTNIFAIQTLRHPEPQAKRACRRTHGAALRPSTRAFGAAQDDELGWLEVKFIEGWD